MSKYVDHVPFYRRHGIDRRGGPYIEDKARVRYTEKYGRLRLDRVGDKALLVRQLMELRFRRRGGAAALVGELSSG